MTTPETPMPQPFPPRCCGCSSDGITRRDLLKTGGVALGGLALTGLAWSSLRAASESLAPAAVRVPILVKPVLSFDLPQRRPQTSWRSWGGVHTQADADKELAHINEELAKVHAGADFPVKFLAASPVRSAADVAKAIEAEACDVVLHYAAGGGQAVLDAVVKSGKNVVFFLRHRSGPVSLWYEIISPRYLRQHTDFLGVKTVDHGDVVVDSLDELAWRLRSLCGLKNAVGTKIVAIGGPAGWSTPKAPDLAREKFKLDIQTVTYPELGELIKAARADATAVALAQERAKKYLGDWGVKLETEKVYVENAFLLEQVFRGIMAKAGCRAITVNNCMGTIMPLAQTTACMTLSLLNDAGFLAFCESDFVVIPSGILITGITGHPMFLNDPTYPHQGVITLAHCTAPRKMDGKSLEAVRLVTHFESDYGAAPKVEMRKGQKVTNIISDFKMEHYSLLEGEIVDAPFLPICRSQIDVAYKCPDEKVALNMPGFHWMTCYGDYTREVAYALKKIPIASEKLT